MSKITVSPISKRRFLGTGGYWDLKLGAQRLASFLMEPSFSPNPKPWLSQVEAVEGCLSEGKFEVDRPAT